MTETTKVFFETLKDAIPAAKNLGTALDDTLSIEGGDKEEIEVAINPFYQILYRHHHRCNTS